VPASILAIPSRVVRLNPVPARAAPRDGEEEERRTRGHLREKKKRSGAIGDEEAADGERSTHGGRPSS
jgi:hypothetical protein